MSTLKEQLISCLVKGGADIVRFGSIERFKDTIVPELMPECKTVVGVLFRILRGANRGVEEGSTFYQYTTSANETLAETVMPRVLMRACNLLEDAGYEASPQREYQLIMEDEESTNPEMDYREIYRGIKVEKQMNFKQAAVLCGLGEIGMHGTLLTDEFGPLQRYGFILTDAEFEEDPIIEPHLCDKCGECVKACPGHAITDEGEIDRWQCAVYYNGANMKKNPFMLAEAFMNDPQRMEIITGEAKLSPERAREVIDQIFFYPPIKQGYVSSICGKACDRACYIHLEEKGVLTRKFTSKFRKRPEWELDLIHPAKKEN